MQAKVIIKFEDLSEPDFVVRAETISTKLENNTSFPEPWPPGVPGPAEIKTDVADYKVAYKDATGGDRAKIKVRNEKRAKLTRKLKKVGAYLELTGDGSVSALATTGFDLRHDIVKGIVAEPPPAPKDFQVTRGNMDGSLLLHARALPHVDVYTVQIATGDPAVETNWADAGTFAHCNRIELTGLAPGKTYYVRLRGFNRHGHGAWATSAGIMVV